MQAYLAESIIDLLNPHSELADTDPEAFHGKHRPGDEDECDGIVDGKCDCNIMTGPGAVVFAKEWFNQNCNTFIMTGAAEKMNPVPVISYRQEGPWTIALLGGVIIRD